VVVLSVYLLVAMSKCLNLRRIVGRSEEYQLTLNLSLSDVMSRLRNRVVVREPYLIYYPTEEQPYFVSSFENPICLTPVSFWRRSRLNAPLPVCLVLNQLEVGTSAHIVMGISAMSKNEFVLHFFAIGFLLLLVLFLFLIFLKIAVNGFGLAPLILWVVFICAAVIGVKNSEQKSRMRTIQFLQDVLGQKLPVTSSKGV
jgi:hypothetical protein